MSRIEPVLELPALVPPLDWNAVFPDEVREVELEIGSGKGMYLRQAAAERPDVGFLGVERAGKWFRLCAERLSRDGRPNVRLVRHDAFDLLARWVAPGSVAAVRVYFPDPWPKKRHSRRRLLCPALYDLAARALAPGGLFDLATDVDWYFAEAVETLAGHPALVRRTSETDEAEVVRTHYAVKYEKQGRNLYAARYERNDAPAPPIPPPPTRRQRADTEAGTDSVPAPDARDVPA